MIRRQGKTKTVPNSGYAINEDIKAAEVRLIGSDGGNRGTVSLDEALDVAQSEQLDLVQIGEAEGVVIAKIMNFGKFLYEKKKQQGEAKKKQKVIQIKELKLRPCIGEGDYKLRISQAKKFLEEGKRVKFTVQFRGREIGMMDKIGPELFAKIHNDLEKLEMGQLLEEGESRGIPMWSKIVYLKDHK